MNTLINETDQIVRWPKKSSDKKNVVRWLSDRFKSDIKYSEKEVNEIIHKHHVFDNIALLRRELVSKNFLSRKDDGSQYWKIDK